MQPDEPVTQADGGANSAFLFPATSWTLLGAARGDDEAARKAMEELTQRYYGPVYAFLRAVVRDADAAEELAQGFFETKVIAGRLLQQAVPSKGRFRLYLKKALRNYVKDMRRQEGRKKRRPAEPEVRPDADPKGWERLVAEEVPAADAAFHAAWVRALLDVVVERVRTICAERGQAAHFELFEGRYLNDSMEDPGWRALGARFGLEEKIARGHAETVKGHVRLVLRQMLRNDVESEQDVDDEIAALLALL